VIIEARTKCNCASASPKALSPTTTTDLTEPAASANYDLPSESDPIATAQDVFGGVDMENYTGKSDLQGDLEFFAKVFRLAQGNDFVSE